MRSNILRRSAAAGSILALSLTLAACGEEETPAGSDTGTEETPSEAESSPSMEESMEETPMESESAPAADAPYGPACDQVPASGPGSVATMTEQPVATAASGNPLLSTLVSAVEAAGLAQTLNSAPALTVFAPANSAFEEIPPADLQALLADKPTLVKVLTHHVVGKRLSPDQVTGMLETLNKDMLTITGSGESATVGDQEQAAVLCGNVQTANATVYIIDTVQMPAS